MGDANASESVILLPGDVEMSAYVGDDDGEARCKLCRYGDGKCTIGLRKIHVRGDPQCRLHGVTSQANMPVARMAKKAGDDAASSRANPIRPLSEMTGFETKKGLMLLYNPEPGDEWINRTIVKARGGLQDAATGEKLTKAQAKKYESFLRRHHDRNMVGKKADKLVRLVDKYLPLQADETRAFVCRFPEQAEALLKRVKKIRRKIRASSGGSRGSTPRPSTTTKEKKTTKKRKGEGSSQEAQSESLPQCAESSETGEHVKKEDSPPDWGGEESDEYRQVGEELFWPWGNAGRPSDRSDSPGILSQRPNEPERDPPSRGTASSERTEGGTISLTPSRMWLDVQQVQAHMARARKEQTRR